MSSFGQLFSHYLITVAVFEPVFGKVVFKSYSGMYTSRKGMADMLVPFATLGRLLLGDLSDLTKAFTHVPSFSVLLTGVQVGMCSGCHSFGP